MTLLILSRAFQIATVPGQIEPTAEQALQESISSIDTRVVQEVVIAQADHLGPGAAAGSTASERAGLMAMKLESYSYQNALIEAGA